MDNKLRAELYYKLKNDKDKLKDLVGEGKITLSDYIEITGDIWEDVPIEIAKKSKIQELYSKLFQAINTQFISPTTGHTYGYSESDQQNIMKQINALNMEKEIYGIIQTQEIPWFTLDAGWVNHTVADFYNVLKDAAIHEDTQWSIFKQKSIEVQNATTVEEVEAIKWDD